MNSKMTPHQHHSISINLPPANCFTILVIDDMLPNRVLLRKVLGNAGYEVVEAVNGEDALDLLLKGQVRPHLIITDIEMPQMDGITMATQLRLPENGLDSIPILAASGNADDNMRRDALAAGCDVFMTKPFDIRSLRREIASLLKAKRNRPSRLTNSPSGLAPNRLDTSADKVRS